MSKLWEITADMIDWDAYKTNVEYAISNEKLWVLAVHYMQKII